MELEREADVLIVGHQAVLRCILCYFLDKPLEELPYVKVPLHTLIRVQPCASGCNIEFVPLGVEAVDTHRPREKSPVDDEDVTTVNEDSSKNSDSNNGSSSSGNKDSSSNECNVNGAAK